MEPSVREELGTFKPVPFFYINTTNKEDLTLEAARTAMRRLKSAGYGGCIFFNKPPTGFSSEGYLSEFWFEVAENFILAAREEELEFWINDGFDYPPGDVAGKLEAINATLKPLRLKRFPDGSVAPVEVKWGYPAFEDPESSRLFIQLTYEEYFKRLGKYFGKGITGFFSDTDNRRVNHFVLPDLQGETYFPWSKDFARVFETRYGYPIEPRLEELLAGTCPALNLDYWRLAGDLYQAWFRNNYDWCRKHGIKYAFHSSDTGPFSLKECPRSSLFCEGEPLKLLAFSDYPGTDHELPALDGGTHYDRRFHCPKVAIAGSGESLKHPDFANTKYDVRAKYVASAAFLHGKKRVLCEAFAATGYGADPALLRRIAAWQIMQGINFLIPHAVRHRFFGQTKFFAPPEFLQGAMESGVGALNDFLTESCFVAAQGEYVAPIGVLDPTPEILAKGVAGEPFFELCDRLNRQSLGYVITDLEHSHQFPILLNPMAGDLSPLPEPDATFDGGELAWMKRRLPDGTEFMLAANIWSEDILSGNLAFAGKSLHVELAPGEIAVIGGPYQRYRTPSKCTRKQSLNLLEPPKPVGDNYLPLHTLREWENQNELPGIRIFVPEFLQGKVKCDGELLSGGERIFVFDDVYYSFPAPPAQGKHTLILEEEVPFETPLFLSGDFHAELFNVDGPQRDLYEFYQVNITVSENLRAVLRSTSPLAIGDWTAQGLPFYSGAVTYQFAVEGDFPGAELELKMTGICEVVLDGKSAGKLLWQPYRLPLGNLQGFHRIHVTVWNTSANRFVGYRAPGGLTAEPLLWSQG